MKKDKEVIKKVGSFRIYRLFNLAEQMVEKNDLNSDIFVKKYVSIALEINRHYKIGNIEKYKKHLCNSCKLFLIPGINCTVRISDKKIIYKCKCGVEKRVFIKKLNKV